VNWHLMVVPRTRTSRKEHQLARTTPLYWACEIDHHDIAAMLRVRSSRKRTLSMD
jgi:hypothetical protein